MVIDLVARSSSLGVLALTLLCCSSHPKVVEDARTAAHVEPATKPASDAPPPTGGVGDVQLRVEWHDVPAAVRASSGRTACATARAPAVVPTTTWGIPDAIVVLAADRAKPSADPAARVVFDRCALAPRALVAGASLAITTTAETPVHLALARRYSLRELGTATTETAHVIELPIGGHEVDVALAPGDVYELTAADDTVAWIVAAPTTYAAITDAAGQAVLRDVPVGKYAATAWLPPHAGQPARLARGEATVTTGVLAEVTLDLSK